MSSVQQDLEAISGSKACDIRLYKRDASSTLFQISGNQAKLSTGFVSLMMF
jgi:hypothetical protein